MAVICRASETGQSCGNLAVMEYVGHDGSKFPVCQRHATYLRERWGVALRTLPKSRRK